MIAVSDALLIVTSIAILGSGLYRWQNNIEAAELAHLRSLPVVQMQQEINNTPVPAEQNTIAATRQAISVNTTDDGSNNIPIVDTSVSREETAASVLPADQTVEQENSSSDLAESTSTVVDTLPLGNYTVSAGDTLSEIAVRFDTSVDALQQLNDIDGSTIFVGQQLSYPLPAN
jgi:LysM repeat protein